VASSLRAEQTKSSATTVGTLLTLLCFSVDFSISGGLSAELLTDSGGMQKGLVAAAIFLGLFSLAVWWAERPNVVAIAMWLTIHVMSITFWRHFGREEESLTTAAWIACVLYSVLGPFFATAVLPRSRRSPVGWKLVPSALIPPIAFGLIWVSAGNVLPMILFALSAVGLPLISLFLMARRRRTAIIIGATNLPLLVLFAIAFINQGFDSGWSDFGFNWILLVWLIAVPFLFAFRVITTRRRQPSELAAV
jgi:hypothetical protein